MSVLLREAEEEGTSTPCLLMPKLLCCLLTASTAACCVVPVKSCDFLGEGKGGEQIKWKPASTCVSWLW